MYLHYFIALLAIFVIQLFDSDFAEGTPLQAGPTYSCTADNNGEILTGNKCTFQCCLALQIKTMLTPFNIRCVEFTVKGSPCIVDGYKYPHNWVIRYNKNGCYVCNNGNQDYYKSNDFSASGSHGTSSLDEYTLIRFG